MCVYACTDKSAINSNGVIPLTKTNRIKGRKGGNSVSEKRVRKASVNGERERSSAAKGIVVAKSQSPIGLSATSAW